MRTITDEKITEFRCYLSEEEKAEATVEKYIRDITAFMKWLCGESVEKAVVLEYKQKLMETYSPAIHSRAASKTTRSAGPPSARYPALR